MSDSELSSAPSSSDVDQSRLIVGFPDGTVIENPHQDAYGSVYQTSSDWIGGINPYVIEPLFD
jgi:hypothetical protein